MSPQGSGYLYNLLVDESLAASVTLSILVLGIPEQDIIAIGRVVQHRVLDLLDVRFLEVRTAHIREIGLQPVSRLEREVLQGSHATPGTGIFRPADL